MLAGLWAHSVFGGSAAVAQPGWGWRGRDRGGLEQSWAVKALVDSAQHLVLHPERWEVPAGLDTRRARQVRAGLAVGDQGVPVREVAACSEVPPETEKGAD